MLHEVRVGCVTLSYLKCLYGDSVVKGVQPGLVASKLSWQWVPTWLASYLGIDESSLEFARDQRGKPYIVAPSPVSQLAFNITHSRDMMACAMSASCTMVGIDIEVPREGVEVLSLAKRFFSAGEYQSMLALAKTDQYDLFYRFWVIKEALLKAKGWGITKLDRICLAGLTQADYTGSIQLDSLDQEATDSTMLYWQLYKISAEKPTYMAIAADAPFIASIA